MGKYKDLWHFQCEYLLNKKNNYVLYIVHTYILYCDHSLLNNFKFSNAITSFIMPYMYSVFYRIISLNTLTP